jgi:hypothetical protein
MVSQLLDFESLGDIAVLQSGTVSKEDAFKLKKFIFENTHRIYQPQKDQLFNMRIAALKTMNRPDYTKSIVLAGKAYQKVQNDVLESVCSHFKLTAANLQLSIASMVQDAQLRNKIVQLEMDIQNGEKITEFKQTREELKNIYIERLRMEIALKQRLSRMELQSPGKNMEFKTIESTRIHDSIFVKYGLKI